MPKNFPRRLSLLTSIRNIFSKPRKAKAPPARRKGREIEALESRIAPAAMVAAPLADLVFGPGKTGATLDLSHTFSDPNITGTVVEVDTNLPVGGTLGKFFIGLTDAATPITVDNFLSYVHGDGLSHAKYDNTIVHRAVPNFVVQLGGYKTSGAHIALNSPVHNEFTTPGLETRGSVAMAKSAGDPNSATSEFFVNLIDNSANLDNQNGGFTVFGNVLGNGLTVVDAIAALPHPATQLQAPFDQLPLQPGPQGQYVPPGPIPLADLVLVKKAFVLPQLSSAPGGGVLSLSVQSDNPGLVTTSFTGTNLNLKYIPGKSGVANVTVHAMDVDGTAVDETFSVTVKPNLVARLAADPLPSILVPGDKGIVKLDVVNESGGFAKGKIDIQFYLSSDGIIDGSDALVGSLTDQAISIAGGRKTTFSVPIAIAEQLAATQGQTYTLLGKITPNSDIQELNNFTDDNVTLSGPGHAIYNAFGTFNGRTNVPLHYHDADNTLVTVTLTGGGFGQIDATTLDATLHLTTASSIFGATTIGGADARTTLHNITSTVLNPLPNPPVSYPLGTVNLPTVDLTGDFNADAGIKFLTLGNLLAPVAGADHTITIKQFATLPKQTVALNFGRIADTVIDSTEPIAAFKALEWIDADAGVNDSLTAPSLVSLTITGKVPTAASPLALRGDFNADITLSNSAAILSSVSIAGFFDNAALRTAGSIAAVTVGAMHHSAVFAGVNSSVASNALPTLLADFVNPAASIGRFTIKGIVGVIDNSDFFIAADKIGVITLRDVATANGGALFGVAAHSLTSSNINSSGDFVVRVLNTPS